jgi:hypothetical protein
VRAQVIKKARTVDPSVFNADKDAVLSEYRGSTMFERYIDPNIDPTDTTDPSKADYKIPDYAAVGDPFTVRPLDTFYRFRVVETKRFNP